MLGRSLPPYVTTVALVSSPYDYACHAFLTDVMIDGRTQKDGIVTYFLFRALPRCRTTGDLRRDLEDQSVRFVREHPDMKQFEPVTVLGPEMIVPGIARQ